VKLLLIILTKNKKLASSYCATNINFCYVDGICTSDQHADIFVIEYITDTKT